MKPKKPKHKERDRLKGKPRACSCPLCCNPRSRKSWASGKEKLTIQERKAIYES